MSQNVIGLSGAVKSAEKIDASLGVTQLRWLTLPV